MIVCSPHRWHSGWQRKYSPWTTWSSAVQSSRGCWTFARHASNSITMSPCFRSRLPSSPLLFSDSARPGTFSLPTWVLLLVCILCVSRDNTCMYCIIDVYMVLQAMEQLLEYKRLCSLDGVSRIYREKQRGWPTVNVKKIQGRVMCIISASFFSMNLLGLSLHSITHAHQQHTCSKCAIHRALPEPADHHWSRDAYFCEGSTRARQLFQVNQGMYVTVSIH